jgi:hypothetical protein
MRCAYASAFALRNGTHSTLQWHKGSSMTISTASAYHSVTPPIEYTIVTNPPVANIRMKTSASDEAVTFANHLDHIPQEDTSAEPPPAIEPTSESWIDKAAEYIGRSLEVASKFYYTPGHGMR